LPLLNEEITIKNLIDINNVCKRLNVPCWLQDGTLLGLIRDGKLIPWDNDADMGCHEDNWNDQVSEELKNLGFSVENRPGIGPRYTKGENSVDIFIYRTEDNGLWSWSAFRNKVEYRFDMPKFSTREMEFWGENFLIPENPEEWLFIKYGKSWRTPRRHWNYATDPANSRRVT
jgi:phosphorylcholine metabolism protein LicD